MSDWSLILLSPFAGGRKIATDMSKNAGISTDPSSTTTVDIQQAIKDIKQQEAATRTCGKLHI